MNASLDIARARFNMVEQQIRTWEVLDQDVLDLLYAVHREAFVPNEYRALAFSDLEIPLGPGGSASPRMWAPKLEARVLQEMGIRHSDLALEVGTGSGYFAALLAHRAHAVVSIEIAEELAQTGRRNLLDAGIDNVEVCVGDGALGWTARAPFDVIVLTGSTPVIDQALLDQLKPGGRLFAVVGDAPVMTACLFTRSGDGAFRRRDLFETFLAPLTKAPQPRRFSF